MKKSTMFLFASLLLVFGVTMVFGANNDSLVLPGWLSVIVSIISFVVGVFVPKSAHGKVQVGKSVLEAVGRAGYAAYMARRPDSDEGKKITPGEWEVILSQGFDGAKSIAELLGKDVEDLKNL